MGAYKESAIKLYVLLVCLLLVVTGVLGLAAPDSYISMLLSVYMK